jgi:hypothetical protein
VSGLYAAWCGCRALIVGEPGPNGRWQWRHWATRLRGCDPEVRPTGTAWPASGSPVWTLPADAPASPVDLLRVVPA